MILKRKKPTTKRRVLSSTRIKGKKALRKQCDRVIGAKCRSLGKCEFCGNWTNLQWCHLVSRSVIHLRYDPRNYACLCAGDHFHGHANPAWFVERWGEIRGVQTVQDLKREANEVKPITEDFYLTILKEVQNGNQT